MTLNNYDASTALSAYWTSRDERRPARLWAVEKLILDMAEAGIIEVFVGAGTDPTGLTDYASDKIWVNGSAGVTDAPATIRKYDGSGDASLVANWPALTHTEFVNYITGGYTLDGAKLDYISVTQAVDLDEIETKVNGLDAAVVLKGTWDASAGTFPGSGAAQAGWCYIVNPAGTVNSVSFDVGDRIIAITDNASTSTYANNWFKEDYTDRVSSVAGRTGAVTLTSSDLTDTTSAGRALLDDADASAQLTTLGVSTFAKTILDDADASAARTTLGLGTAATLTTAQAQAEVIGIAVGDETTAITTGTAKRTFRMPFAMTLTSVRASLTTVSSSGTPTIDINEGGTTILSTKLTIDANEKTSTTAATAAVISDASLADDAEITIDIDTAGTGAAGLKVYLIGYRT